MRASKKEMRMVQMERSSVQKKADDVKRHVDELERRLRKGVQDVDKENGAMIISYRAEIKSLNRELKELSNELKAKDLRIKKLESVRLTRDQIVALKKLKEERAIFEAEAREYKDKFKLSEKEIISLRTSIRDDKGASSTDVNEIESLKEAKKALEIKLRKYAAHCQHLEHEKSNVIEMIKSCIISKKSRSAETEDDFIGFVEAICEKLRKVEEECSISLNTSEERAASYRKELNLSRKENSMLQSDMSEFQRSFSKKMEDVTKTLKDVIEEKKSLHRQCDEYQKMVKNAKANVLDLGTEKGRQVRYLEQENLQLMLEVKTAKREAQNARAECAAMTHCYSNDNNTMDLSKICLDASITNISEKENITSKNQSLISPQNSSSYDIQMLSSTSSSTKVRKSGTPKRRLRTLGDDGTDLHGEDVSECKQS